MRILTVFIASMFLLAGCGEADRGGEAAMEKPMEETMMTEAPAPAADEGMTEETPQWAQLEQNVMTPSQ